MEDNTNNEVQNIISDSDINAIVSELKTLNKSTVSTSEKLSELQEYLIIQDNNAQREKEAKAKAEAEQAEQDQLKADEEALYQEEANQEAENQTETYTELLTDIRDELDYQNQLQIGQIFFLGILFGVLLGKIFIDRFIKL